MPSAVGRRSRALQPHEAGSISGFSGLRRLAHLRRSPTEAFGAVRLGRSSRGSARAVPARSRRFDLEDSFCSYWLGFPSSSLGISMTSLHRPSPRVHSRPPLEGLRSTDATCRSRFAYVVSRHPDDFLRARQSGFVAPRFRPWDSPDPGRSPAFPDVRPFADACPFRGFPSATSVPLAWPFPSCCQHRGCISFKDLLRRGVRLPSTLAG